MESLSCIATAALNFPPSDFDVVTAKQSRTETGLVRKIASRCSESLSLPVKCRLWACTPRLRTMRRQRGMLSPGSTKRLRCVQKVAAEELPPVEERLPLEPLVCVPVDGIGEYGGILAQDLPARTYIKQTVGRYGHASGQLFVGRTEPRTQCIQRMGCQRRRHCIYVFHARRYEVE